MEKIKIETPDITLELSLDKVKELVRYLEMDEIIDSMVDKGQIENLIERLCMDHADKFVKLLSDFFDFQYKSFVKGTSCREEIEAEYLEYISNRYKTV